MSGPPVVIVMGVSGSGKSTVAEAINQVLHWPYQEGDALHPAANVAKMKSGIALTDGDRGPWLASVRAWVDGRLAAGTPGLITCSALKRVYRAFIVGGREEVRLLYLRGSEAVLQERLEKRTGHFMPASLLQSQLATLEEPGEDEHPMIVGIDDSLAQTVQLALEQLRLAGAVACGPEHA